MIVPLSQITRAPTLLNGGQIVSGFKLVTNYDLAEQRLHP